MFAYAGLVLAVMVVVYIAAKLFKLSTELAMFAAALGGALAGGFGLPARHIALKDAGGIAFVVRRIIGRFHRSRTLLFVLLTVLLLVPGALTGAGSVTVLITGGLVAIVLQTMGISKVRTVAIVFIIAGLSAAAPPVSLWAMLTAAGVNMPYIGFFMPLLVPCVVAALFTIFFLGRRSGEIDLEKALQELPSPPEGMSWLRVALPFGVFVTLIVIGRAWPHDTPVVGLPLMFLCAAAASYVLSPIRLDFLRISRETIEQLLPLIGTLTCVGVLVQIMTLTGVRGLLAVTTVTLSVALVFATLFIVLPVSEAVLMWGAAPVIGVPLVLLFNTIGLNPIVALAGMSVIWPLGDALPPTAIIGRLTVDVVGYRDAYAKFLKSCMVPAAFIMVIGTLMVIFSSELSFLTGL
jgi:CitMHS family citrate-Mg2+:H+ or citrate-Ca2+:H+ symporter